MQSKTFITLFEQTGMSLVQFSKYFGIPYKTAIKWKNGERECSKYLLNLMEYQLVNEGYIQNDKNKKEEKTVDG